MVMHHRSVWRSLTVLGLIAGAALYLQTRLPLGEGTHTLLLLFWIVLFYAALFVWTRRHGDALDAEPPALDVIGRPIIDSGSPVFTVETEQPEAPQRTAPTALGNVEAY